MFPRFVSALVLSLALLVATPAAQAGQRDLTLDRVPGFPLAARLSWPGDGPESEVEAVALLLHGSGPQDMDEDLAGATQGGARNPFFVDLTEALAAQGIATLRYHKRSFVAAQRAREDKAFLETPGYRQLAADPLGEFLADARHAVGWLRTNLPGARVLVVGHSQGCWLALWLAHEGAAVDGLGLIGFALQGIDTLVFEQTVYRPLVELRRLDLDHDGSLSAAELSGEGATAASLRAQRALLDLDGDGALSFDELQAGNLSNSLLRPSGLAEYRRTEATLPDLATTLRETTLPVAFLQGEWDNQTPARNARAVQLVHRVAWQDRWMRFEFFPGLGHALDRRDRYDDLVFRRAEPVALQRTAAVLAEMVRDLPAR